MSSPSTIVPPPSARLPPSAAVRPPSVAARPTASTSARTAATQQLRQSKARPANNNANSSANSNTIAASSATVSHPSLSASSTRLTLPPRPSSATGSLSASNSARRFVPRLTLADRAVLTDVDYIADWLLSVRQSGQLQAFAPLIARLKKAIFTPEQVRRHKTGSSNRVGVGCGSAGVSGRHVHSSSTSVVKEHSEQKEQATDSYSGHTHTHTHSASDIDNIGGGRVLPAPSHEGSKALSTASTSSSPTSSLPAVTSSPTSSSTASSMSASPLSSSPRSAASGVDPSDALDLDELEEWDEKVALFSKRADRQQSEQDRHSNRQHRQQQPSLVPVGVQFVHGRWVAAGAASAVGIAPTAAPLPVPGSATTSSSSPSWPNTALTTLSLGASSLDGSASPPSASPSSRLLNDASDSQSSTPDLSPVAVGVDSDKTEVASFPDDLDDLPDWNAARPASSSSAMSQLTVTAAHQPPAVSCSSPSISLQSTTSSISSLSGPLPNDEFDELDSIPDFESSAATAPIRPDSSATRTSELLAAKMAQFPDDMTVVELKEIDDRDDNTAEDGETDDDDNKEASPARPAADRVLAPPSRSAGGASGVPTAASPPSTSHLSVSAASTASSSSSVVSRLHNRLLRVSMGSVEQFPADIDELPDDTKATQHQSTAPLTAHLGKQLLSSTIGHGISVVSSWLSLTPASSAPSARVLNEFALPDSLTAFFQQQETAHTACSRTQHAAHSNSEAKDEQLMRHSHCATNQQPVLSRELQLRFIMAQAETAQYCTTHHITSQTRHTPNSTQRAPQPHNSKVAIRSSAHSPPALNGVQTDVARVRAAPAAPARKRDNWTDS